VFDLQDKITAAIVGIIEPNLRRAEIERAQRKRPESLDAYDLYLRALPHLTSVMPEEAAIGMGLLEEALKLDPNYANAHAYLAWALEMRFYRGGYNEADAAASVHHARAAVIHGGDDATALAIAAIALLHLGHDFEAASGAMALSHELNLALRNFGSPSSGSSRSGGSPRPERLVSEDSERAAGCEMALDVECVEDSGVNRQKALGWPDVLVTGKLRSYGAAMSEMGLSARHEQGLRKNNRAENSHQPRSLVS
jgi:hypothetical protein